MLLREGTYERLFNKRSQEMVYNNMEHIRDLIEKSFKEDSHRIKVLHDHGFDIPRHFKLNNKHTAINSKGCGCILCSSRHNLAKAVNSRRVFKISFESEGNLFSIMYTAHKKSNGVLNEEAFFDSKLKSYDVLINDLRIRNNAASDTINHILCC